jgi:hypothetical protein
LGGFTGWGGEECSWGLEGLSDGDLHKIEILGLERRKRVRWKGDTGLYIDKDRNIYFYS